MGDARTSAVANLTKHFRCRVAQKTLCTRLNDGVASEGYADAQSYLKSAHESSRRLTVPSGF